MLFANVVTTSSRRSAASAGRAGLPTAPARPAAPLERYLPDALPVSMGPVGCWGPAGDSPACLCMYDVASGQ